MVCVSMLSLARYGDPRSNFASNSLKESPVLLATYVLATLEMEQKCERTAIRYLQDFVAQASASREFDYAALTIQSERLILLAEFRHRRRLESALFPALRSASDEAARSLQTLENLGQTGIDMVSLLREALRPTADVGQRQIARACRRVNAYCQNLLQRLACEEEQVLPLAHRVLSIDVWLNVGTEFLVQDSQRVPGDMS
jgi:response regulator RpfG family c-di-GMP phosphodiesterase